MNLRKLGKTNRMVSEIGLGTWQLGTRWGDPFNEAEAMKILEASYDSGINLIDTADIYNDGNSEKAIGKFLKPHKDHFFVVTKCGRGLNPHVAEGYTPENMEAFIDGSLRRLEVEQLDLVLLHCPPTSVYHKDSLFAGMDKLVEKGKIAHYGVSIEKVAEGLAPLGIVPHNHRLRLRQRRIAQEILDVKGFGLPGLLVVGRKGMLPPVIPLLAQRAFEHTAISGYIAFIHGTSPFFLDTM